MPKVVTVTFDDITDHDQVAHYDQYLRVRSPWGNEESQMGPDLRSFDDLIEDYLFHYLDRDAGTHYTNIVAEAEKTRLRTIELRQSR